MYILCPCIRYSRVVQYDMDAILFAPGWASRDELMVLAGYCCTAPSAKSKVQRLQHEIHATWPLSLPKLECRTRYLSGHAARWM